MTELNISGLSVNFTQPGSAPPKTITTADLLEVCRQMDDQALYSAITGLVLGIAALLYFGRLRPWLAMKQQSGEYPEWCVPFCDKLLLTGIAMCFVIIIVRLLRAG